MINTMRHYPRDLRTEKFNWDFAYPSAVKSIQWRREKLEEILEPYVTSEKSEIAMRYRDRDCYLIVVDDPALYGQVLEAACALQFAYRALVAIDALAPDVAEQLADSLLGYGYHDGELSGLVMFGVGWWEAAARLRKHSASQRANARRPHDPVAKHWPAIRKEIERLGKQTESLYAACDRVASRLREGTFGSGVPVINRTGRALVNRYKSGAA